MQVQPVVEALGLTPYGPPLEPLHFWWWALQGLLLAVLVRCLAACDPPCEDECGDEELEVVVVVAGAGLDCTNSRLEEAPREREGKGASPQAPRGRGGRGGTSKPSSTFTIPRLASVSLLCKV